MIPKDMQDQTGHGTIPYGSGNIEFTTIRNNNHTYTYTHSHKSMISGNTPATIHNIPFDHTISEITCKTIPYIQLDDCFDLDDILTDDDIKGIEEAMADIVAGRTYTSEQVKKMLELE